MRFTELLIHGFASSGGFSSSGAIEVAVIGGSFSLLAILMSYLLDRGKKTVGAPDVVTELRRRAEKAERDLTVERRTSQKYRDWLVEAGINPATGGKMQP